MQKMTLNEILKVLVFFGCLVAMSVLAVNHPDFVTTLWLYLGDIVTGAWQAMYEAIVSALGSG
jgi:hypothetical protein